MVLATGVRARQPDIPGVQHAKVVGYADAIRQPQTLGRRVALIGAGGIGFDVAELLSGPAEPLADAQQAFLAEWGVDRDLQTRGGAIRLGEPTGSILGVAEGIETALACWKATGIPTWSTLNRVLMEQFVPPAGVEQIVIFADKDRSGAGQLSAAKLAQRLLTSGRDVVVIQPRPPIPDDAAGIDWNDVLCTQGPAGFAALHLQGGNPLPDATPAVTPTV